ncbi:MAG: PilZ domain-containing protein [Planctomycetota bacterium]
MTEHCRRRNFRFPSDSGRAGSVKIRGYGHPVKVTDYSVAGISLLSMSREPIPEDGVVVFDGVKYQYEVKHCELVDDGFMYGLEFTGVYVRRSKGGTGRATLYEGEEREYLSQTTMWLLVAVMFVIAAGSLLEAGYAPGLKSQLMRAVAGIAVWAGDDSEERARQERVARLPAPPEFATKPATTVGI